MQRRYRLVSRSILLARHQGRIRDRLAVDTCALLDQRSRSGLRIVPIPALMRRVSVTPRTVHGCARALVQDCHCAVFSHDDLSARRLGRGIWVDSDVRLGRPVGAPGADMMAESFGESGAVGAVSDGAEAGAVFWCLEVLGGEVGDGVAFGQGHGP